jgi:hypothetical protein
MARMRALEGKQLHGDDPMVVYLTAYMLTLDACKTQNLYEKKK